jgi:mutator protein MutT
VKIIVDVVVGIILKNGRILAEKRKINKKVDPGIVGLLGGHVQQGETKEQALIREMKEELNINIKKFKFISKDFWIASNGEQQNLFYYLIEDFEGEPICNEAEELLWLERAKDFDTEVDRNIIKKLFS